MEPGIRELEQKPICSEETVPVIVRGGSHAGTKKVCGCETGGF